jgi:hypothetical protein
MRTLKMTKTAQNKMNQSLNLPLMIDINRPMFEAVVHEQESPSGTWGIVFQGSKDKAEQIVQAVNSHAALVEALKAALEELELLAQMFPKMCAKRTLATESARAILSSLNR